MGGKSVWGEGEGMIELNSNSLIRISTLKRLRLRERGQPPPYNAAPKCDKKPLEALHYPLYAQYGYTSPKVIAEENQP